MNYPFFRLLAILLAALVSTSAVAQDYPRIGAYEISGHKKMDRPYYRKQLAKHDIVILGLWKGWRQKDRFTGYTMDFRDVVIDIKDKAAANGNAGIKIGKYTNINEVPANVNDSASSAYRNKAFAERGPKGRYDWFARTAGGATTSSWPGNYSTNITNYVTRDRAGNTYTTWRAKEDYKDFFSQTPELDIWFFDNWFYTPRVQADWNGDGRTDKPGTGTVDVDFQTGMMNGLNTARSLAPHLMMMGNVEGHIPTGRGMLTEPRYRKKLNSLFEFAIGESFSVETWGGWQSLMRQYRTTINNSENRVMIFLATGQKNNYRLMRYGLATTLMDDGYYYYTHRADNVAHLNSAWWYDEYDFNLGAALEAPPTKPWRNGMYKREFKNGMALVNPKGNGRKTVAIPPGYKRLSGKQAPQVNNGRVVRKVTLQDRDGLILEKI